MKQNNIKRKERETCIISGSDFLGLFQTPDMTLTRRNQMLCDWFILQGKTNKQKRTAPLLSIHLWPGHVANGYCNIQWI